MEKWLTVEEVAALLKITDRAVRKNALAGKYGELRYEDGVRGGNGGQAMRIALSSLPPEAQVEYISRSVGDVPCAAALDVADGFDAAPQWKRQIAGERLRILAALDAYIAANPSRKKTELVKEFAASWKVTNEANKLSDKTLYRWQKLYREGGRCALLPDYGKRENRRCIDPQALEFFKKLYCNRARRSIADCYRDLADVAMEMGWRIPSMRTLQRIVDEDFAEAVLVLTREGEKAYRNKCAPFIQRDPESIAGNQVWVGDHYRLDCFVRGANGKPVRPWLTAWLDWRSFKLVGWHIGYSPSTDTIMAAFAEGALDKTIGLPREIYVDNGRDYTSYEFAGRGHRKKKSKAQQEADEARVRSLVDELCIVPHFAIPENARSKVVERFFRIVSEQFCRRISTYCGSDDDERPEGLDEALKNAANIPTLEDIRRLFRDWAIYVYNRQESSGKGRAGECPDETFARTRLPLRSAAEHELRLCLMRHSQPLTVRREGIVFMGQRYYNPQLIEHLGQKVYIRYRDEDMTKVYVYALDEIYICEAYLQKMLSATGATKEDLREAKKQAKRARRIIQQAAEISQEIAAIPDDLERTIARRKQNDAKPQVEPPKVIEPLRLNAELRRAARETKQAEQAKAVGQTGGPSDIADIILKSGRRQTPASTASTISDKEFLAIIAKSKT